MKRAISLLILATAALHAAPALADAHDKAVAAFEEGRKYIEAGNCDAAITKLSESIAQEPSVGAHLSLADCYERTDPYVAWKNLKEAARIAFVKQDQDRFAVAERRSKELEPKLARIALKIAPSDLEEAGFELRVDGALVDRFFYKDGVIATRPGRHVVEAQARGRRFSQTADTELGGATTVAVQLAAEECRTAPARAATPIAGEPPGSAQRAAGLVLGGVGLVGVGLGAVMGGVTLSKKAELDRACGGSASTCTAPPGSLDAQRESASNAAMLSTVGLFGGGVALVAGAVLFLTAPRATPTTAGPVRVVPSVGSHDATMRLEGHW